MPCILLCLIFYMASALPLLFPLSSLLYHESIHKNSLQQMELLHYPNILESNTLYNMLNVIKG